MLKFLLTWYPPFPFIKFSGLSINTHLFAVPPALWQLGHTYIKGYFLINQINAVQIFLHDTSVFHILQYGKTLFFFSIQYIILFIFLAVDTLLPSLPPFLFSYSIVKRCEETIPASILHGSKHIVSKDV
jgi:hypothetical protein